MTESHSVKVTITSCVSILNLKKLSHLVILLFRLPLIESILRPLYENATSSECTQIVRVRRRHLWSDALRTFSKKDFLPGTLLSVHFIGEEAADLGGPRREFLRLLLRSLVVESGVLTGCDTRKVFTSNPLLVTKETYYHAGQMVATSLIQGGPGLKCLSPAMYAYFCGDVQICRSLLDVEDIPGGEVQQKVKKVQCTYMYMYHISIVQCDY